MMKTTNKTLTLLTLICYLAVMSITSVHALPSLGEQTGEQTLLMSGKVQPSCHQNTSSDTAVVGACQLFCSTMSNIISNEIFINFESQQPTTNIVFLTEPLPRWQISVEPRPPK